MQEFRIGDYVCAEDRYYGYITKIAGNMAVICAYDYSTMWMAEVSTLKLAEHPVIQSSDRYDGFQDAYERDIAEHYVDEIASALETLENWEALRNCVLVNGRSDNLRELLMRIFRDNVYILTPENPDDE